MSVNSDLKPFRVTFYPFFLTLVFYCNFHKRLLWLMTILHHCIWSFQTFSIIYCHTKKYKEIRYIRDSRNLSCFHTYTEFYCKNFLLFYKIWYVTVNNKIKFDVYFNKISYIFVFFKREKCFIRLSDLISALRFHDEFRASISRRKYIKRADLDSKYFSSCTNSFGSHTVWFIFP